MVTSAPTRSNLCISSAVWRPDVAAREMESWGLSMAIQRSGNRSSALVLSVRRGPTCSVSRAMSGSKKRLKSTRPSTPSLRRADAPGSVAS